MTNRLSDNFRQTERLPIVLDQREIVYTGKDRDSSLPEAKKGVHIMYIGGGLLTVIVVVLLVLILR